MNSLYEKYFRLQVSGADEYDMVNGADSGMLDEEAERRAFQEAVMAWRTGGGTTEKGGHTLSLTSYGKSNDAGSSDNGMWSNPFGENVDSEVGMGLYDDKEIIVSARGVSSDVPSKAYRHNEGAQSGKSLADGSLDEEREQAVCNWHETIPSQTHTIYYDILHYALLYYRNSVQPLRRGELGSLIQLLARAPRRR